MQQRAVVPSISRFEPIIEQFVPFLRATVQQLNLQSASHELTQEAKRRFRQRLESEEESTPVAATLYRLSVAATLETMRAAKKQKEVPAIVWVEMTAAAQSEAEQRQSLSQLQTVLTQLPENRRRPVALQLLGLSPSEIGPLLGWSEAKTRQQTERGLRTLRTKLREGGNGQKIDEAELKTIYQTQPTRAELNRADCLADEFLARACAGDINADDRFFVADHLATCRDCAEEYQLVHALKLWADEAAKSVSHPKQSEAREVEISSATFTEPESGTEALLEPEATPPITPDAAPEVPPATQPETKDITPKWWQALLPRVVHYTGFNLFTAALAGLFFVTSLSLATWLVALQFKHKTQLKQLQQQQVAAVRAEPATPEMVQARLEEAQKQLTDLQTQIIEQNADKVLSNQELLGIQNDTLQKELEDLSKPQLDAPVVDIDLAALRATTEPGKEIVTTIDVPNTSSVFTIILHKPAAKNAANYLLELFEAKKPKAVWSAQKKLETQTKIAVTLAKRNYPAGQYRFALSGLEGKKKELLETYQFEVKYQPPPKQKKKK